MATKLKNGKFRAQVFLGADENGKRLYKSFVADTADEADFEALSFKLGRGKSVDKKTVSLRAAMTAYIQSRDGILSPSTIEGYRVILRNFGDYLDTPIDEITNLGLQQAFTSMAFRKKNKAHNGKIGLSPKTLRNYRGLVKKVLKQNEVSIGDIAVPDSRPIEYNTPFNSALAEIFRATKGTKIEVPVLLASWCSLRASEILGLQYKDIDFVGKSINIRRAKISAGGKSFVKNPKTKSSFRTVFLPEYIAEKIKHLMEESNETPKSNHFIFDFSGTYITKSMKKALEKNGLPHCRFHDLRHAFVSILTEQGVDQKYIQEMGGWSTSQVMNQIYKQTSPALKNEINEKLQNVFMGILEPNKEDL